MTITPIRRLHPDAVASPAYWDTRRRSWVFSARHGDVAVCIVLHRAVDAETATALRAEWVA